MQYEGLGAGCIYLTRTARVGSVAGRKLETIQRVHERWCGNGVLDEHDRNVGADQRGSQILDAAPPPPSPAALIADLILTVGVLARWDEDDDKAAPFDVGRDALLGLAEHNLVDLLPPLRAGREVAVVGRGFFVTVSSCRRLPLAPLRHCS